MISMKVDDRAWYAAYLDTPLTIGRYSSPAEAMKHPGCAVKTRERICTGDFKGFPVHTGKLVYYSEDLGEECLVRGHGDAVSPKFVWRGTVREYLATWECD